MNEYMRRLGEQHARLCHEIEHTRLARVRQVNLTLNASLPAQRGLATGVMDAIAKREREAANASFAREVEQLFSDDGAVQAGGTPGIAAGVEQNITNVVDDLEDCLGAEGAEDELRDLAATVVSLWRARAGGEPQ